MADQTEPQQALRKLLAIALYGAEYPDLDWRQAHGLGWDQALNRADAVLAALFGPIPTGTDVATWTAIRAIQLMNETGHAGQARAVGLAEGLRYVLDYTGPRHCHDRPGMWDTSGKPCGHCAELAKAREHLAAYDATAAPPMAAQPVLTPCTCRQAVHVREHKNLTVPTCPWCTPTPNIRPNQPAAARTVDIPLPDHTVNDNAAPEPGP